MEKLVYTVAEASSALGVHHLTLRRAIARGEIRAVRVGRRLVVPVKALDSFLEGQGQSKKPVAIGPAA